MRVGRLRRRDFLNLLGGAAVAWPFAVRAQQPVIGYLHSGSPSPYGHLVAAFRQGLKEAGYVEGQNVAIEFRWARGHYDLLAALARDLTNALPIPVIGIGAGVGCSGQVLVLHDMLGVTGGEPLRFVRNFMDGSAGIELAVRQYVADVKGGRFPDDALHGF